MPDSSASEVNSRTSSTESGWKSPKVNQYRVENIQKNNLVTRAFCFRSLSICPQKGPRNEKLQQRFAVIKMEIIGNNKIDDYSLQSVIDQCVLKQVKSILVSSSYMLYSQHELLPSGAN